MTRDDREFWERVFLAAVPGIVSAALQPDSDPSASDMTLADVAGAVAIQAVQQRAACCPPEPAPPFHVPRAVQFGDHGEVHEVEPEAPEPSEAPPTLADFFLFMHRASPPQYVEFVTRFGGRQPFQSAKSMANRIAAEITRISGLPKAAS